MIKLFTWLTKYLLFQWKHYDEASVERLFQILESMDRFDVIDDNKQKILEDMKVADNLLKVKVRLLLCTVYTELY